MLRSDTLDLTGAGQPNMTEVAGRVARCGWPKRIRLTAEQLRRLDRELDQRSGGQWRLRHGGRLYGCVLERVDLAPPWWRENLIAMPFALWRALRGG